MPFIRQVFLTIPQKTSYGGLDRMPYRFEHDDYEGPDFVGCEGHELDAERR